MDIGLMAMNLVLSVLNFVLYYKLGRRWYNLGAGILAGIAALMMAFSLIARL